MAHENALRVMITGGTGFVGYHTAKALLQAGHEISLLVRNVPKMLEMYSHAEVAHYTCGDITDTGAVHQALRGCDAFVHAAAMVSTDARHAELVYQTNIDGTKTVITAALEQGVKVGVHVSSVTALYDSRARVLDDLSPPGIAHSAYGRSKVACEHYVRSLQTDGQPIHITYPVSVIGPDDPGLTEPHAGLQGFLKGYVPVIPTGNQYVDVRDVANVHRVLLDQVRRPGRYPLGGHYVEWRNLARLLTQITGRQFRDVHIPGAILRQAGRVLDKIGTSRLRHLLSADIPLSEESTNYATRWVPMDSIKVEQELNFNFRPIEETMSDTIRWLFQAGYITAEQAGNLAVEQ